MSTSATLFLGQQEQERRRGRASGSSTRRRYPPAVFSLQPAPVGKPLPTGKKTRAGGEMFPFYSEENSGLQLGPKTVVILGLLFMGIVVLLHIISKLKA